jgi:hypothetical protein
MLDTIDRKKSFYLSISEHNLQMRVDRIVMLIQRLIAHLSVYIFSFEEYYEDLFICGIYRALNNVR